MQRRQLFKTGLIPGISRSVNNPYLRRHCCFLIKNIKPRKKQPLQDRVGGDGRQERRGRGCKPSPVMGRLQTQERPWGRTPWALAAWAPAMVSCYPHEPNVLLWPGAFKGFASLLPCPWYSRGLGDALSCQQLASNNFVTPWNGPQLPCPSYDDFTTVSINSICSVLSSLVPANERLRKRVRETETERTKRKRRKSIPKTWTPNSKSF